MESDERKINMLDYKVVTEAREAVDYVVDEPVIGADIETAPDTPYRDDDTASLDPQKSHITTLSLSVRPGSGIVIPVAHKIGKNMDPVEFQKLIASIFMDTTKVKVVHNLAFESKFLVKYGIAVQAPVYDTIAAAQLMRKNATEYRTLAESGLKTLAAELLGTPLPTFSTVTDGKFFDELDPADPETIRYSGADADYALRLYYLFNDWFDRFMPAHRWMVEHVESPAAVYVGIMEYYGVPIDSAAMHQRKELAEQQRMMLQQKISGFTGSINIGANASTKAFKDYLFRTQNLPILVRTEKGEPATNDTAMTALREWCEQYRPDLTELFTLVQDYRKCGKIATTYLDGYLKYQNAATGRIHPNFFSLGTDTGRFSCARPNLQNMPRKTNDPIGIRDMIRAPEGHLIMSIDFSQIELRVGAFYCRDSKMMETYRTGGDIHAQTTSVIFGISYEEAKDKNCKDYKERRSTAKRVNFGVFYGLYPKGLQANLKSDGVIKTYEECDRIIQNLKAGYPGLSGWQASTIRKAHMLMYTETWLGRRRYLPNIRSDDWGLKAFAERCALNTPIQGTAADIIKLAMGRIIKGLPERPWLQPILQIHDELTFIVPEDRLFEAITYVKQCMEETPFPEFDIPLVAEPSAGKTFGSLQDI